MNRRTFSKLAGLGVFHSMGTPVGLDAQPTSSKSVTSGDSAAPAHKFAQIPSRTVEWPSRTFRRHLVDTHIPDWDDSLLASFDPANYVSTIADAGFQSLMQYANSHVGLCLWRTKVGRMHRNMKGRDYFGEVMEQCHRRGLHRVAYYSLIFDDWAFRSHPDWRILSEDGSDALLHSRTGTVCINSPYREHVQACLNELVSQYDFEAIFLDMTFWPTICYCPHCISRYWAEHGAEPPRVVDWENPEWRAFQRSRERWMSDFAHSITETIKKTRTIQVSHQCSTVFNPWTNAVPLEQFGASDFCTGDFYGGTSQFSLVCKAYLSLSRTKPFEFCTTRTLNLHDFETTKPFDQLSIESMIPMVHSSACLVIDAIKPSGQLNHQVYQFLSQINALHDPYEPFLGGEMLADVAIYYDKSSVYDPESTGLRAAKAHIPANEMHLPHLEAVIGAARSLREAHIPFGVITNVTLDQLGKYRAVILPSVLEMSNDQSNIFRDFVTNGGVIYASGPSSLSVPGDGERKFLLGDVLGVKYLSRVGESITYLTPKDSEIAELIWPQENLTFKFPMIKAEATDPADVLGTITLPFVAPSHGNSINTRFAQIWNDPPAKEPGEDPGVVVSSFGKGKTVWVAAPIESREDSASANVFLLLLKRMLQPPFTFEADTDPAVEVTLFHQENRQRLLVSLLNMRSEVPATPVDAKLRVRIPKGHHPKRVSLLQRQEELPYSLNGSYINFEVPAFALVSMVAVDYE